MAYLSVKPAGRTSQVFPHKLSRIAVAHSGCATLSAPLRRRAFGVKCRGGFLAEKGDRPASLRSMRSAWLKSAKHGARWPIPLITQQVCKAMNIT